jgi:hypothetical protein
MKSIAEHTTTTARHLFAGHLFHNHPPQAGGRITMIVKAGFENGTIDERSSKLRTAQINRLQRKHPGTRRQRSYHGNGKYTVQFFSKSTGELVGDYNLISVAGYGR